MVANEQKQKQRTRYGVNGSNIYIQDESLFSCFFSFFLFK